MELGEPEQLAPAVSVREERGEKNGFDEQYHYSDLWREPESAEALPNELLLCSTSRLCSYYRT